ncbi:MAG: D-alanyl-D-alanine carboxypeptidase [Bacilli bacterium]|nr:D-alanyl-D-alanine carboxypeptidase [Bacilli bacterium]
MKKIVFLIFSLFVFMSQINAQEDLAPNSKSAILIEQTTGKILFEKNSNEKLAPASMTKVMSMLLIMEAVDDEKINMQEEVTISENASSMGGSQVFLEAGEIYTVEELLKGIAIASGNDAVVAMAEKVAGSTEAFVKMMNNRAKELGLLNTNFVNPHGLDEENHYTTAHDMAIIAQELLKYSKILEFTSIYEYYMPKPDGSTTWLVNTNRLVRFYDGVDGLKTGFTSGAGYCLTATAQKKDLRLISVVMGVETADKRSSDTVNLLDYGFNTYKLKVILNKKQELGKVRILNGKQEYGTVVLLNDATELLKVTDKESNYTFNTLLNKKIKAPVKNGDIIGTVEIIDNEGHIVIESKITIKEDIKKANLWDLFKRNLNEITSGKSLITN